MSRDYQQQSTASKGMELGRRFCHQVLLRRDSYSRIVDNDRNRGAVMLTYYAHVGEVAVCSQIRASWPAIGN